MRRDVPEGWHQISMLGGYVSCRVAPAISDVQWATLACESRSHRINQLRRLGGSVLYRGVVLTDQHFDPQMVPFLGQRKDGTVAEAESLRSVTVAV